MSAPRFAQLVVMGDDALLLAEITTLVGRRRAYLPILSGPRLQRPDRDHEAIRRARVIARVRPQTVIFAGLPDATCDLFSPLPPRVAGLRVQSAQEVVAAGLANRHLGREPFYWGRSHIGVGVLEALRSRRRITFVDMEPSRTSTGVEASHIVVCEDGDPHAQVVAAAYALAIDAGLCVFPECSPDESTEILEALYGLSEGPAPASRLDGLRTILTERIGPLDVRRKTLTFVTAKLPWGLAFPTIPSTHLFRYPDLGIAIVNGVAGEQENAPGVRSAVVIAPHSGDSLDARTALIRLTNRGVLSKALRGAVATVHQAAKTITLFPYDLLLVATHCSDAPGYRCTYEFIDTDGRSRTLVLDETAGAEFERPDAKRVHVTVFESFVSLDGVDWSDREGKAALPMGAAMTTYIALRSRKEIEPVRREPVARVRASMALRMADGNYIALPDTLASDGSPIVINNACGSWHRLAETFMGSGARCYVGALFSVVDAEAEEVVSRVFGDYQGRQLATALARAQAAVYGNSPRRPYVMVGCHFQRIRKNTRADSLAFVRRELQDARDYWRRQSQELERSGDHARTLGSMVDFLEAELALLDDVERRGEFQSVPRQRPPVAGRRRTSD